MLRRGAVHFGTTALKDPVLWALFAASSCGGHTYVAGSAHFRYSKPIRRRMNGAKGGICLYFANGRCLCAHAGLAHREMAIGRCNNPRPRSRQQPRMAKPVFVTYSITKIKDLYRMLPVCCSSFNCSQHWLIGLALKYTSFLLMVLCIS